MSDYSVKLKESHVSAADPHAVMILVTQLILIC